MILRVVTFDAYLCLEWFAPVLSSSSKVDLLLVVVIQNATHGIQDKLQKIVYIASGIRGAPCLLA